MHSGRIWRTVASALVTIAAFPLAIAANAPELRAATGGGVVTGLASQNVDNSGVLDDVTTELPTLDDDSTAASRTTSTTRPEPTTSTTLKVSTSGLGLGSESTEVDPSANQSMLVPAPVPRRRESVELAAIGRIKIAAAGVDETLREGVAQNVINAGPAHWPGTAAPGGLGNAVIAGHRSTYSRPFHDLANLKVDDTIVFETVSGWRHTYSVERQFVVASNAMWIVDQTDGRHVTLFTCHPIGSSRQRLITVGVLVKSESLA